MKRISIIGGGISGLAVLHYLKQRLGDAAHITLYEREASAGGTVRSFKKNSALFEWGPNGFLNNQPATLQLIEDLNLTDQLIQAQPTSSKRFIQIQGVLHQASMNPLSLAQTPLLTFKDKIALWTGLFKNVSKDQSIHEHVSQKFSANIAEIFIDSFVTGVYAGDIRRLHMASAFPKLKHRVLKRPVMFSLKEGMGSIIEALSQRYQSHIQTNSEITINKINADITVVATPAYAASKIVESLNPDLTQTLDQIPYAPMAVAGLLFQKTAFKKIPQGFGYLVPSRENKDILGVLIESNIFSRRAGDDEVMLRVMLGGAHHPGIINDSTDQILAKARKEIDAVYGLTIGPMDTFVKSWPKAIPQYELNYPQLRCLIDEQRAKTPGLYLCANYLDGVSFNDCIAKAQTLASLLSA
jgi:oxygen-dependent protoporphyrinogen oxidase